MEQLIDPEEVARFENATWSRCARGYMDGFGALAGEAIRPLLDEVNVSDGPLHSAVIHRWTLGS